MILRRVVVNSFVQTPLISEAESDKKKPLTKNDKYLVQVTELSLKSFMTEVTIIQKSMEWFLFDGDLRHDRVKFKPHLLLIFIETWALL